MLELVFIQGSDRGKVVPLTFDKAWFGGQDSCDFVLHGDDISQVHFGIVRRGMYHVLIDNKSTNGTFVNRVLAAEARLYPGDQISAGSHVILVREASDNQAAYRFVAEWKGGDGAVQVFQANSVMLGRQNICQIQLNEPAVAAVHALIEHKPDGVWVTDHSSSAGVYVNGQRIVRQQLQDGDCVRIDPFEITIRLGPDMCGLSVQQAKSEAPIQAALPIWVPASDLLPNRFRNKALLATFVAVLLFAGYAVAGRRKALVDPGPLSSAHAGLECSSCHAAFQGVKQGACQACHAAVRSVKAVAGAKHEHTSLACTKCHSEHRGASFDIKRNVGSGCQASGCHVTVHTAEKAALAAKKPPNLDARIPLAVAFEVRFENLETTPDDPMHAKHIAAPGGCAVCHTNGDPKIRVTRVVERERCLRCHGFGPQATLRDRCYSCHFEHPTATQDVLAKVRFDEAAVLHAGLVEDGHREGILLLLAALVGAPLLYFGVMAVHFRLERQAASTHSLAHPKEPRPGPGR